MNAMDNGFNAISYCSVGPTCQFPLPCVRPSDIVGPHLPFTNNFFFFLLALSWRREFFSLFFSVVSHLVISHLSAYREGMREIQSDAREGACCELGHMREEPTERREGSRHAVLPGRAAALPQGKELLDLIWAYIICYGA
jgi:hypothetical protein